MISIAFALALAAAPTPATIPAAGACTLLNLAACADAGPLARDPGFQAALRQFVGQRRTGYLTTGGAAYSETLTVLSGPADPVRRVRSLYLFTACADAACDDEGAAVLQPDGELAAVAILHSDCGELRHVGDCVTREVLSILRGPDDDLSVVEALSDWARRGIAARPIVPNTPIRNLDRVEVVALAGPDSPAAAPRAQPVRAAPPIALPSNPAPVPPPAAVATVRPVPAPPVLSPPPPAPIARAAEPPKIVIPPPRAQAQAPVALPPPPFITDAAPPLAPAPPPAPAPRVEAARAEPPPLDAPVTPVEGVTAVAPRQAKLILTPMKVYLTLVRTEPRLVVIPPPPPPPPPKPKKAGWQFHSTPYDCRKPAPGHLALGPVALDPLAASCKRWQDDQAK